MQAKPTDPSLTCLQALKQRANQLLENQYSLQEQNQALSAERDAVAQQRDGLQFERDALQAERDSLTTQLEELIAQRESIQQQRDGLQSERDQLATQHQELSAERDRFAAGCDSLNLEYKKLAEQNVQLWAALQHIFPIKLYRDNRPDLIGYDDNTMIKHFVQSGINESIAKVVSSEAIAKLSNAQLEKNEILEASQKLLRAERDELSSSLNKLTAKAQNARYEIQNVNASEEWQEPDENMDLLSIHLSPHKYSSDKWESYFKHYERNLSNLRGRQNEVKLLEIGVQNGGSLEVWKRYLGPSARIIGTDINSATGLLDLPNQVSCFVGDATDPVWADKLCKKQGPFNIVIDDGSHINRDIIKSFFLFFPSIKAGGIYICEDLHTAYWEKFDGCPPRRGLNAIELFKEIADLVNLEHWRGLSDSHLRESLPLIISSMEQNPEFTMMDLLSIESVEFCNSMVFIRKASGGPASLGPRIVSNHDAEVEPGTLKESGMRSEDMGYSRRHSGELMDTAINQSVT